MLVLLLVRRLSVKVRLTPPSDPAQVTMTPCWCCCWSAGSR